MAGALIQTCLKDVVMSSYNSLRVRDPKNDLLGFIRLSGNDVFLASERSQEFKIKFKDEALSSEGMETPMNLMMCSYQWTLESAVEAAWGGRYAADGRIEFK